MILKRLKIATMIAEPTNCYIICDEKTKETMVIDPAGQVNDIIETINILHGKLKYIYLTHCHGDHIGGVNELKEKIGGEILIHRKDTDGLKDVLINLSPFTTMKQTEIEVDARVDDNDLIHIGELEFRVIHTPGHTMGSTCLYCDSEKLLISGDTLFRGTCGRTDLPTSDHDAIIDSIVNKLLILPDDTICYPGHGKSTMIKEEKPNYLTN